MAEDEGDIEYLDEDEDLVQQYVNTSQPLPSTEEVPSIPTSDFLTQDSLLIERKQGEKRKYKDEDDSDYDPNEDLKFLAEERKKKRYNTIKKVTAKIGNIAITPQSHHTPKPLPKVVHNYENKLKSLPNLTVKKTFQIKYEPEKNTKKVVRKTPSELFKERKKFDIRIPDYYDALCLPALAVHNDYNDQKLSNWNNQCLEQFKKIEVEEHKDSNKVASSVRSILFRNVKNKNTGKIETSVWGKNTYTAESGDKTTEIFQSILPKFRDKTMIKSYNLTTNPPKFVKHTYEAILTKEIWKEETNLVVYKPKEATSAIYRFINDNNSENRLCNDNEKRVLREMTCCKICAPCYHTSWRGIRRNDNKAERIGCNICNRSFVSLSTLLNHLKLNHKSKELRKHKSMLSKTVAKMVDYHYKCRICQEMFLSIKLLRRHVKTQHKGRELFKCEIGNHIAS